MRYFRVVSCGRRPFVSRWIAEPRKGVSRWLAWAKVAAMGCQLVVPLWATQRPSSPKQAAAKQAAQAARRSIGLSCSARSARVQKYPLGRHFAKTAYQAQHPDSKGLRSDAEPDFYSCLAPFAYCWRQYVRESKRVRKEKGKQNERCRRAVV